MRLRLSNREVADGDIEQENALRKLSTSENYFARFCTSRINRFIQTFLAEHLDRHHCSCLLSGNSKLQTLETRHFSFYRALPLTQQTSGQKQTYRFQHFEVPL